MKRVKSRPIGELVLARFYVGGPFKFRVVLTGTRTATSSRFSRSAIMNGVELVH